MNRKNRPTELQLKVLLFIARQPCGVATPWPIACHLRGNAYSVPVTNGILERLERKGLVTHLSTGWWHITQAGYRELLYARL